MKRTSSEKWLLLAAVLAFLHHIDHVLRVDRSGWPFRPEVTPFTFTLVIYPIFLSVFLVKSRPWYRVAGTAVLFLAATLSHTLLETPMSQYHTWAHGSNVPGHVGQHNLLGQDSTVLGICAAVLTVLLSLTLLVALVSFIKDARKGRSEVPVPDA